MLFHPSVCLYLFGKDCPLETSICPSQDTLPNHPHLLPPNKSKISYLLCTTSVTLTYNFCCIKIIYTQLFTSTGLWRKTMSFWFVYLQCSTQCLAHVSIEQTFGKMKNVSNLCKLVACKVESRLWHSLHDNPGQSSDFLVSGTPKPFFFL